MLTTNIFPEVHCQHVEVKQIKSCRLIQENLDWVFAWSEMISSDWRFLFVWREEDLSHHWSRWLVNTNMFCSLVPGSPSGINGGLALSAFVHMVFLWRETSPAAALHFSTGEQTADFLENARWPIHRASGAAAGPDGPARIRWPSTSDHIQCL